MRHSTLVLAALLSIPGGGSGGEVERQTAILQGFLYIPDATSTLVLGADWLATRIDTENLHAGEDGPIVSLQGRFRFSEQLGRLLGVDRSELDSACAGARSNLNFPDVNPI